MHPDADARTAARRGTGFTLLELVAVLAVVSLAVAIVLPRLPGVGELSLRAAAGRLGDRLSAARERAILGGRTVHVDLRDGLPRGVRIAALEVGGSPLAVPALALAPDGDPLEAVATLADESGARVAVALPAGFAPARELP
jgi:type II secretion system protein H